MQYEDRINQQIIQYANSSNMHEQLPSVMDYWKEKYMKPHFVEVSGVNNHIEFYAKPFVDRIQRTGLNNVISLGSGDGGLEVQIAKKMKEQGCTDFIFNLVELSSFQIERAINKIKEANLTKNFNIIQSDFNSWTTDKTYAGVMAHHSLHHVLELEHLFEAIRASLHHEGAFVSFDMIGRNGHARWPEALAFIERIWKTLPVKKKYHHLLKQTFEEYYNHDCSKEGFEGIRSQDILPLLVKYFNFEVFYAYGNLVDVFIGRGYGANYNPKDPQDLAFIDFIEFLDSTLIYKGILKPTKMGAIMSIGKVGETKIHRNLSPDFCIRPVEIDVK